MSGVSKTRCVWGHLIATLSLGGCASSGSEWVREVARPTSLSAPSEDKSAPDLSAWRASAADDTVRQDSGWPRRTVITLGEHVEAPDDRPNSAPDGAPDGAPEPSSSTITSVTNNYYLPGYGYSYGYGVWPSPGPGTGKPGHGQTLRPPPSAVSLPAAGGNWPSPPSYGPPMMSRTAPANPWR